MELLTMQTVERLTSFTTEVGTALCNRRSVLCYTSLLVADFVKLPGLG
jgi:hypothetical protein